MAAPCVVVRALRTIYQRGRLASRVEGVGITAEVQRCSGGTHAAHGVSGAGGRVRLNSRSNSPGRVVAFDVFRG